MSKLIGFYLASVKCHYCGKEFHYNGATCNGWEKAFKKRNSHETICPKRFGFDENMRKVGEPMEDYMPEFIKDIKDMVKRKRDIND